MTIDYGPVVITRGPYKGRIGIFDDCTTHRGQEVGIVIFSDFGISLSYKYIPVSYLAEPNTNLLFRRRGDLMNMLSPWSPNPTKGIARVELLEELHLVDGLLGDRLFAARLSQSNRGAKIFISYSSNDKRFVRGLSVDLKHVGHRVWLDEWEIKVGESIPKKISDGIESSDFVAIVLSKNSIKSRWVEREWQTKYWDEINQAKVAVLPILIEDCTIPTLLKTKKYADFRRDYTDGLEQLCFSIAQLIKIGPIKK